MTHVFVETNWIVSRIAPAWFHDPEAAALHEKHRAGKIQIHVPVISIHEARSVLPRFSRNRLRELDGLVNWILAAEPEVKPAVQRIKERGLSALQSFEATREKRLMELVNDLDDAIFPYRAEAMALQLELAKLRVKMKPFDQAIFCSVVSEAILERARDPEANFLFCTLDGDFTKKELAQFAEERGVPILGTFEIDSER